MSKHSYTEEQKEKIAKLKRDFCINYAEDKQDGTDFDCDILFALDNCEGLRGKLEELQYFQKHEFSDMRMLVRGTR